MGKDIPILLSDDAIPDKTEKVCEGIEEKRFMGRDRMALVFR